MCADFSSLPDTFLNAAKTREVSVHADIHLQSPSPKHGTTLKNGILIYFNPVGTVFLYPKEDIDAQRPFIDVGCLKES